MNRPLKNTFDQIHADENLKARTKEYIHDRSQVRPPKPVIYSKAFRMAAACFLLICCCAGGLFYFLTPAYAISIDVNPSIELGINAFDRVVSVQGYNEDGKLLANRLHLQFMNYSDALECIISDASVSDYLTNDETMTVTLIDDTDKSQERLTAVEDCISHHENAVCYSGNSEEAKEAHDCGLSLGKYRAFLELKELDPNITPEDIQGWSMKEIQNRISELSDGETTNASSSLEETSCEETSASGHHQEQKHKGHHWD